jgi:hypothetical protein
LLRTGNRGQRQEGSGCLEQQQGDHPHPTLPPIF